MAYEAGEIDILPVFDMELYDKELLDGKYYQIYQDQINAYREFNQLMVHHLLERKPHTMFGSITSKGFVLMMGA